MWKSIKHITAVALGCVAIVVFEVQVGDVLWGEITRKVLCDQDSWTEELARLLLVWVSFLGGAIAYLDDKHLGVDILLTRIEPGARRDNRIVIHVLVFLFAFLVMGIGGSQWVVNRWQSDQVLPALEISKAWLYLAVPVSGFLISLFALGNVIERLVRPEEVGVENGEGAQ